MRWYLELLKSQRSRSWTQILGAQALLGLITGILLSVITESNPLWLDIAIALFQLTATTVLASLLISIIIHRSFQTPPKARDIYWCAVLVHIPFLIGKVIAGSIDVPTDILGLFIGFFFITYALTERFNVDRAFAVKVMATLSFIALFIWGIYLMNHWQSEYHYLKRAELQSAHTWNQLHPSAAETTSTP